MYSGVENIFRRIAIEVDIGLPVGGDWHQVLLRQVTRPTETRPAVISEELSALLKQYFDFRHLFRNLYVFRLRWERMEQLVIGAEQVVEDLTDQLAEFIVKMNKMMDEEP